jgi:beta-mannosidase
MEEQQVSAVIKRNRNHPSLVMWGGGNENGFSQGNDEGLFLLGRRCRQYDPSRPFHRTDPWGGSAHNWSVFHSGAPMDDSYYSFHSVFYGEYGLPSMPNRSSCLKFLPAYELDQWPMDDTRYALIQHMNQFSSRDPIKVLKYADYGPIKDWNTYIEYSQMAQGDWLRFAAEGQRSASGRDKTGFWFYKLTDLFPGHSWAVVDFYGSPKLSYYRAKQTCQPRSAFAVYRKLNWTEAEPFEAVLHVANDTATPLASARVTATIYGSDLSVLWSKDYEAPALGSDERKELARIQTRLPATRIKPFLLAVTMRDNRGKLISDQWYWYNYQAKTEQMKEIEKLDSWRFPEQRFADAYAAYAQAPEARLLNLPRTELEASCKRDGAHGSLVVRNKGALPAFNVLIDNFPDGYQDFLDENSFCLRPGEERIVTFETGPRSSLENMSVRAWNAAAVGLR